MRIIRSLEEIPEIENAVLTIGSFDGVHRGHQKIISRITQLAQEINGQSVIITFDPHPRSVIYPKDGSLKLLNTLDEKIFLMEKYGIDNLIIVPFTIEFSQQHPREYVEKFLLKYFTPAYIAIGYDHKFGLNRSGDINLLKSYEEGNNFKVIRIEVEELEEITISSTNVRNAVQKAEMVNAHKFLNYHYLLSGKVTHGEKLGKELGFPTANINISDKNKLIPPDGVYAVFVRYDGRDLEGMLYIGQRPTIKGEKERRIEVNIFDFDENIYGEFVCLEIVTYLRGDSKFENLNKLKGQLHEDEVNSKLILAEIKNRIQKSKPQAIIAILNYNGLDHIESYLPQVLFSSKDSFNVLLSDNNSTDGSVEYLKEWHPEVKLLQFVKNYGFAEGYNRTLSQLDYKYTVILNNDVLVTENWLDPIIEQMESDETIAACQPKIRALAEPTKFEYAGAAGGYMDTLAYAFCKGRILNEVETDKGQYDENAEIFWASGAAMVVRTDVFNKLGGFDKSYFAHYEEIDLCWRMKRAGFKIMAVNKSVVYHLGGGTLPYQNSKKIFLNFRNSLITFLKNDSSHFKYFKFFVRLCLDGAAAFLLFVNGQWNAFNTILKAHFYIYTHFRKIMRSKKHFDSLISEHRIGPERNTGKIKGIIPLKYYILGQKKYSDLK